MNLNILRYVIAVDEEKSFTKAAQKLYVSQPSLSQSIQTLEKQMGVLLFHREKTPLELTAAGEIFLEWAKTMLHSEEKMLARISAISGGGQRKLTIGASHYLSKSIFLDAVIEFYEQVKNCTIVIYEQPHKKLLYMLDDGKIDLIADMPHPDTIQYTSIHITKERLFIAADKKFNFNIVRNGEYPSILLSEIMDKPFIVLEHSMYLGAALRSIFTQYDVIPNIVFECQSTETAYMMVTSKIGISLIPELYLKNITKSPDINYYVIADIPLSREIAVVYRNNKRLSDDERVFTNILQNQFI